VLDSFGLMSLLSFLEDRYDLVINNNQVVAQNFESIRALTIFVESKLAEKEAGVAASA
jgi:acyl carrier protein